MHGWLCEIAHRLEPPAPTASEAPPTGAQVRQRVESYLDEVATTRSAGRVPAWLEQPVAHLVTVLRRLGDGLYHCYDVPGLPRTDNDLEQFYRRVKAQERRITGQKRSDTFVVRVGGFAVYATAASEATESELLRHLGAVPAAAWQAERATSGPIKSAKRRCGASAYTAPPTSPTWRPAGRRWPTRPDAASAATVFSPIPAPLPAGLGRLV